ncbi:MAG: HAD-IIIC family phosphatase [Christensenellaceae bacterium]|nr:HAD-IIIC family phosphatase [Christensenellaceae bacterium]MBR3842328.1 HAD-IIIC family phosphatase [Christensenellaceae bacterium]
MLGLLEYPLNGEAILAKKRALKKQLLAQEGLVEKKIAILSGSTIGEFKNILEIFLLYRGIKPVFFEGQYGMFFEDAVFSEELRAFAPDIVYFHTSNKNINAFPEPGFSDEEREALLQSEYSRFEKAWQSLSCVIIQNNFEALDYRLMGNMDSIHKNGRNRFIARLNALFGEYQEKHEGFYINDINYLAASFGLDKWHDRTAWYLYKYLCTLPAIPHICDSLSKIIKAIYGKNKKSMAIDLDNTLWGGVIGDDGVSGIALGKESPQGMVYADLQDYIKTLGQMGISLNICSKNEEAAALSGFTHPSSILKKEDFILIKANWEPKSENIASIAKELNIGLDSVVFFDDNPAERQIVRGFNPEVEAPELTEAEDFLRILDRKGYFETIRLMKDDLIRNEAYRGNIKRQAQQAAFTDYGEYLRSLAMRCRIEDFGGGNIARVTQLINKTNQFNFTTWRLSEAEVLDLAEDPNRISFAAALEDRFGDNGIVGILSAEIMEDTADISLFLMSCRVFKRDLENVMLQELILRLREKGVKKLIGRYIPTAKNVIIKDFYPKFGFETTEEEGRYVLDIAGYEAKNYAMEIIRK